jgi:hypothetical protein
MRRGLAALAVLAMVLAGCGADQGEGDDDSPPDRGDGPALPVAVECGTQYRPDATQLTGAQEPELRVEPSAGSTGGAETVEFETMTLSVTYRGDAPEGRTVELVVQTAAGEPLTRTLYQIGDWALQDVAFAGGHGFTGLHYVSHAGAELQVWCEAVDV